MKINQISPQDNAYLQILEHIANAPKLLNYIGKLPTERKPTVAIVGTRKPTAYGKDTTYRIAYELVQKGVVIVSGLALGVDALAHRAALEAGGTTIAVLGNGLPTIYPSSHRELARNIVAPWANYERIRRRHACVTAPVFGTKPYCEWLGRRDNHYRSCRA